MLQAVIVADDLTGAADTAAAFCGSDRSVAVSLFRPGTAVHVPVCDVLALDVQSRGCLYEEAYKLTYEAVTSILSMNPGLVYKKLDSGLRGSIGSECDAVIDATGMDICIVCAAVPRLGRTTVNGVQHINGVPVHETEMGRDPMNPVRISDIAAVIRETSRYEVNRIGLDSIMDEAGCAAVLEQQHRNGVRFVVCDAQTDDDLDAIVRSGMRAGLRILWAGAAGLAQALSRRREPEGEATSGERQRRESILIGNDARLRTAQPSTLTTELQGGIWFVSGSQTAVTARQLAKLEDRVGSKLDLTAEDLLAQHQPDWAAVWPLLPRNGDDTVIAMARQEVAVHFLQETAEQQGIGIRAMSGLLLGTFAQVVHDLFKRSPNVRTLVLIGGETTRAVMAELGIESFFLEKEFSQGMIEGRTTHPTPLRLITKSGAFGDEDALVRLWERFKKGSMTE